MTIKCLKDKNVLLISLDAQIIVGLNVGRQNVLTAHPIGISLG